MTNCLDTTKKVRTTSCVKQRSSGEERCVWRISRVIKYYILILKNLNCWTAESIQCVLCLRTVTSNNNYVYTLTTTPCVHTHTTHSGNRPLSEQFKGGVEVPSSPSITNITLAELAGRSYSVHKQVFSRYVKPIRSCGRQLKNNIITWMYVYAFKNYCPFGTANGDRCWDIMMIYSFSTADSNPNDIYWFLIVPHFNGYTATTPPRHCSRRRNIFYYYTPECIVCDGVYRWWYNRCIVQRKNMLHILIYYI